MDLWGEGVYRVLVGKPEGKRPLGRPRGRWVDNIRMDLWGEGVYRVLVGKPEGKNYWGDLGVDGWIILEWICGEKGCIGSWCGNRRERITGET
jgi:hypothetical protein